MSQHRSFKLAVFPIAILLLALSVGFPGTSMAVECAADLDGNDAVTVADMSHLYDFDSGTNSFAGDFNGDGEVGCFDISFFIGQFGMTCTCQGDVDGDGVVGKSDANITQANMGNDCRGDLDQNGSIDGNDVDAFVCLFGTASSLGDFNGDGWVTAADLTMMLGSVGTDCQGDVDLDGDIDGDDATLIVQNNGPCS